jgi:hypothetical protein
MFSYILYSLLDCLIENPTEVLIVLGRIPNMRRGETRLLYKIICLPIYYIIYFLIEMSIEFLIDQWGRDSLKIWHHVLKLHGYFPFKPRSQGDPEAARDLRKPFGGSEREGEVRKDRLSLEMKGGKKIRASVRRVLDERK